MAERPSSSSKIFNLPPIIPHKRSASARNTASTIPLAFGAQPPGNANLHQKPVGWRSTESMATPHSDRYPLGTAPPTNATQAKHVEGTSSSLTTNLPGLFSPGGAYPMHNGPEEDLYGAYEATKLSHQNNALPPATQPRLLRHFSRGSPDILSEQDGTPKRTDPVTSNNALRKEQDYFPSRSSPMAYTHLKHNSRSPNVNMQLTSRNDLGSTNPNMLLVSRQRERAKHLLNLMHKHDIGYSELVKENLDSNILRGLFAEIGFPMSNDSSQTTTATILQSKDASKAGQYPFAQTKIVSSPTSTETVFMSKKPLDNDREAYIARLAAARSRKSAEVLQTESSNSGHSTPALHDTSQPGSLRDMSNLNPTGGHLRLDSQRTTTQSSQLSASSENKELNHQPDKETSVAAAADRENRRAKLDKLRWEALQSARAAAASKARRGGDSATQQQESERLGSEPASKLSDASNFNTPAKSHAEQKLFAGFISTPGSQRNASDVLNQAEIFNARNIPGLTLMGQEQPWSEQHRSEPSTFGGVTTPRPMELSARKRPVAVDFDFEEVQMHKKRSFGTGLHDSELECIIHASDDEEDVNAMDDQGTVKPKHSSQAQAASFLDKLANGASTLRHAPSLGFAASEDLLRQEREILEMKKRIALVEQRKRAKKPDATSSTSLPDSGNATPHSTSLYVQGDESMQVDSTTADHAQALTAASSLALSMDNSVYNSGANSTHSFALDGSYNPPSFSQSDKQRYELHHSPQTTSNTGLEEMDTTSEPRAISVSRHSSILSAALSHSGDSQVERYPGFTNQDTQTPSSALTPGLIKLTDAGLESHRFTPSPVPLQSSTNLLPDSTDQVSHFVQHQSMGEIPRAYGQQPPPDSLTGVDQVSDQSMDDEAYGTLLPEQPMSSNTEPQYHVQHVESDSNNDIEEDGEIVENHNPAMSTMQLSNFTAKSLPPDRMSGLTSSKESMQLEGGLTTTSTGPFETGMTNSNERSKFEASPGFNSSAGNEYTKSYEPLAAHVPQNDPQRQLFGTALGLEEGDDEHAFTETSSCKNFTPYKSSLSLFKGFQHRPEYKNELVDGIASLTNSSNIDPKIPLCEFELAGGKCNNPKCPGQHLENSRL